MPRNPHKIPCQVPGCRSWAMRGHTRCRAHRDAELGPRGGGAPPSNLNALRTGRDAHPVPPGDLAHLARRLISDPAHLPLHLQPAIVSIHARAGDPFKTLVALQAALAQLLPLVAQLLFLAELEQLLRRLAPHRHSHLMAVIRKRVLPRDPQARLTILRSLAARLEPHLQHPAPLPAVEGHLPPATVPSPSGGRSSARRPSAPGPRPLAPQQDRDTGR